VPQCAPLTPSCISATTGIDRSSDIIQSNCHSPSFNLSHLNFIAVITYGQISLSQHHLLVLKYVSVVAKDVFAKRRQETGSTDSRNTAGQCSPNPQELQRSNSSDRHYDGVGWNSKPGTGWTGLFSSNPCGHDQRSW